MRKVIFDEQTYNEGYYLRYLLRFGRGSLEKKKANNLEAVFNRLLLLDPSDNCVRFVHALIYVEQQKHAEAKDELERISFNGYVEQIKQDFIFYITMYQTFDEWPGLKDRAKQDEISTIIFIMDQMIEKLSRFADACEKEDLISDITLPVTDKGLLS